MRLALTIKTIKLSAARVASRTLALFLASRIHRLCILKLHTLAACVLRVADSAPQTCRCRCEGCRGKHSMCLGLSHAVLQVVGRAYASESCLCVHSVGAGSVDGNQKVEASTESDGALARTLLFNTASLSSLFLFYLLLLFFFCFFFGERDMTCVPDGCALQPLSPYRDGPPGPEAGPMP